MTKNMKLTLTVAAVTAALLLFVVLMARPSTPSPDTTPSAQGAPTAPAAAVDPALLVRPDSHRLTTPGDSDVTLVEFLDFECESCGAAYPLVERLRAEYGDRVHFVVRYFPIPTHANAVNAAVAVEAAAAQGAFEGMYQRMFATQAEWGEQQDSKAPLFRQYAQELGLDLAEYDRAVADPATLARVSADRDDGIAAGVQGTPTFFLDGVLLQPRSADELRAALDQALAR